MVCRLTVRPSSRRTACSSVRMFSIGFQEPRRCRRACRSPAFRYHRTEAPRRLRLRPADLQRCQARLTSFANHGCRGRAASVPGLCRTRSSSAGERRRRRRSRSAMSASLRDAIRRQSVLRAFLYDEVCDLDRRNEKCAAFIIAIPSSSMRKPCSIESAPAQARVDSCGSVAWAQTFFPWRCASSTAARSRRP